MNQEGNRMKHGKALLLALATVAMTACGSTPGAEGASPTGPQPRETDATRTAGVHLVQAGLSEGEAAREQYREALTIALRAIDENPDNPKGYLVAGQAAVGLGEWVQADTMFDRAEELFPGYAEQVEAEREQGWVFAYNEGAEAISAGDLDRALEMFRGADRIYQGRPEARVALGSLYAGQGDLEAAADAYVGALEILQRDPPEGLNEEQLDAWQQSRQMAALNAAELLGQRGDFDRAASILQDYLDRYGDELDASTARRAQTALAGFYAQAGDAERAEAMYTEIMGREDLTANEYFQAGIGFFNTGDYDRAAEAFGTAAELNPYSRDSHLNLLQSLYSQAVELEETEETTARNEQLLELYTRILDTADSVRELDPLNRNVVSFMLRSLRAQADLVPQAEAPRLTDQTQELFREYQNQPYEVSDIGLSMETDNQARISGTLTNLSSPTGESVQLRFEILSQRGQVLDATSIDVTAPEAGEGVTFTGMVDIQGGDFGGWRYTLVR